MTRASQAGVSMVELLAGTAIGLIVVAAAASVVAANQVAARRVQIEARLMQDLRGAAELVGRDPRRASHWAAAASGVRLGDAAGAVNPIGSTGTARRVCRYVGAGAGAIDANIASGGDDIDVSTALIGRNFLVVRGSEGCPDEPRTARTEPHQP